MKIDPIETRSPTEKKGGSNGQRPGTKESVSQCRLPREKVAKRQSAVRREAAEAKDDNTSANNATADAEISKVSQATTQIRVHRAAGNA